MENKFLVYTRNFHANFPYTIGRVPVTMKGNQNFIIYVSSQFLLFSNFLYKFLILQATIKHKIYIQFFCTTSFVNKNFSYNEYCVQTENSKTVNKKYALWSCKEFPFMKALNAKKSSCVPFLEISK